MLGLSLGTPLFSVANKSPYVVLIAPGYVNPVMVFTRAQAEGVTVAAPSESSQ
jgi:hypothetical protein